MRQNSAGTAASPFLKWALRSYSNSALNHAAEKMLGYSMVTGYQHFLLGRHRIVPFGATRKKTIRLSQLFRDVKGKSFLDIGCSSGFFCFQASIDGADRVLGVDVSEEETAGNRRRAGALNFSKVSFERTDFNDVAGRSQPFDFVLLVSLVHRLYGLPGSETFDVMFERVSKLTNEALIAEYIPPTDFHSQHVFRSKRAEDLDTYSEEAFLAGLNKYFSKVSLIGDSGQQGRRLFLAWK